MLGLLDLVFAIGDLLMSWRMYVGLAVTAGVCWLIASFLPNETAQWAVCVPIGVIGLVASIRWQLRADLG